MRAAVKSESPMLAALPQPGADFSSGAEDTLAADGPAEPQAQEEAGALPAVSAAHGRSCILVTAPPEPAARRAGCTGGLQAGVLL